MLFCVQVLSHFESHFVSSACRKGEMLTTKSFSKRKCSSEVGHPYSCDWKVFTVPLLQSDPVQILEGTGWTNIVVILCPSGKKGKFSNLEHPKSRPTPQTPSPAQLPLAKNCSGGTKIGSAWCKSHEDLILIFGLVVSICFNMFQPP